MNQQTIRFAGQAMRGSAVALAVLLWAGTPAVAQVSISINLPVYPELVRVPNYPVYYAPRQQANYFFYDGMYWVYQQDNWYASSWYNGPWSQVNNQAVPLFVLRIPVRYYRNPPAYFTGWRADAPPHWGDHWGNEWSQQHRGWDRWDRRSAQAPAPLPSYQRQYTGNRYPQAEQQHAIQSSSYRYKPRDAVVQQHFQQQQAAPTPQPMQGQQPQQQAQQQHAQSPPAAPGARAPEHDQGKGKGREKNHDEGDGGRQGNKQ